MLFGTVFLSCYHKYQHHSNLLSVRCYKLVKLFHLKAMHNFI